MPDDCFTIEWGKCYSRDECRAVGIIRYGAGVLDWTKEELKSINLKARKLNYHEWESTSERKCRYLARKEGGRGLISYEECVNVEVQNLDKYLSESEEWMLKFVAGEKRLSEVENVDVFKKRLKEEK